MVLLEGQKHQISRFCFFKWCCLCNYCSPIFMNLTFSSGLRIWEPKMELVVLMNRLDSWKSGRKLFIFKHLY